jgi:phosphatidylglycerol:prolipoprotein diacylglycerol transferase
LGELSLFGFEFQPTVHVYGLLLAAGFLFAVAVAAVRAKSHGVDARFVMDVGLAIIVSAFLGAKLLFVMVHFGQLGHVSTGLLTSGGVFYGGFVAAAAASIWLFQQRGLSVWLMTDLFAPSVALGHAIGRLGCFSAGCCYGKSTDAPWGVTFTDVYARRVSGVPLNVPLHPTQLYEALTEFALFALLLAFAHKKRFDGQMFWGYVAFYSVARFVIEFFRGDMRRGFFLGGTLSTSQLIAAILLLVSCFALATLRRQPCQQPA